MEYPLNLYKSAELFVNVANDEEKDAALADGWFLTVPEALAGKADDNSAPTREELELKATELGIKFDGRTSDAKLGKLIAEKV